MDELDLRLLKAMGLASTSTPVWPAPDPARMRAGPLARATGVPLQTVKDRLRRMREDGVLLGRIAFPNWHALGAGLDVALARFPEEHKAEGLAVLREAPWVAGHLDFVGPWAYVQLFHRSPAELEARLARLRNEAGATSAEILDRPPAPRPSRRPTPLEARIMAALVEAPDASGADLAARLGVTERTVRARLGRLEREGFLVVFPYVDRAALPGLLLPHVLVRPRPGLDPEAATEAVQALGDRALTRAAPRRGVGRPFDVVAWGRSLIEMEELRRRVAACPSVADALVLLPQDGHDRLDELVEAVQALAR